MEFILRLSLKKKQIYPTIMAYIGCVSTKKCDGIVGCSCDILQINRSISILMTKAAGHPWTDYKTEIAQELNTVGYDRTNECYNENRFYNESVGILSAE